MVGKKAIPFRAQAPYLCFALYAVDIYLMRLSNVSTSLGYIETATDAFLGLASTAIGIAVTVAFLPLAKRFDDVSAFKPTLQLGAFLHLAGVAVLHAPSLFGVAPSSAGSAAILLAGNILIWAGRTCVSIGTTVLFVHIDANTKYVVASFLCAAAVCSLASFLGRYGVIACQVAVPFAIWAVARECDAIKDGQHIDYSQHIALKRLLVGYFSFVFVFSLGTSFSRWAYYESNSVDVVVRCITILCCTAIAAFVIWTSKKSYMRFNSVAVYRAVFLFFILSFCSTVLFPTQNEFSYSMQFVADMLLRMFVFLTMYKICQRGSISPAKLVCATTLMRLAASFIFGMAEKQTDLHLYPMQTVALFIAAFAVVYTVALTEHEMEQLVERRKPRSESFIIDSKCTAMGQRYQFSKRELEIVRYLVTGRTAAFIADELFLSPRTVNTHIRNIYKKMGIHSRQEFFDIYQSQRAKPAALEEAP